jgi:hypothetical protein
MMILESLVSTLDRAGNLNVAPMGPEVDPNDWSRFVLKPFRTSTTFRNLRETGVGVMHVTDDVLLLARAAIGPVGEVATRPAEVVEGRILLSSARYHEFRVVTIDDASERTRIVVESVARGSLRELFGLNRGKFAVVEAAILATRLSFLPLSEVQAKFAELKILVEKTGGPEEHEAFTLLEAHLKRWLEGSETQSG